MVKVMWRAGALALSAMLLLLAPPAAVAVSSTWSPTSQAVSLKALTVSLSLPKGASITCPVATFAGTTPATAGSTISTAAANVTYAGTCTSLDTAGLAGVAAVTTSGTWGLTISDPTTFGEGGGPTLTCGKAIDSCIITIHVGGMTIQVTPPLFSDCTITVPAQSVSGVMTDGNTSLGSSNSTVTAFTSGGVCGLNATTATLSGTYTSTNITITSV